MVPRRGVVVCVADSFARSLSWGGGAGGGLCWQRAACLPLPHTADARRRRHCCQCCCSVPLRPAAVAVVLDCCAGVCCNTHIPGSHCMQRVHPWRSCAQRARRWWRPDQSSVQSLPGYIEARACTLLCATINPRKLLFCGVCVPSVCMEQAACFVAVRLSYPPGLARPRLPMCSGGRLAGSWLSRAASERLRGLLWQSRVVSSCIHHQDGLSDQVSSARAVWSDCCQ